MLMLSEYAEKLDHNVKKRYMGKILELGVDPVLIPGMFATNYSE